MATIADQFRKKFNASHPFTQAMGKGLLFLSLEIALLSWLFYPALMQEAAMQWDATEIYLPWKYFLVEQFHQGHWPLWNLYMSGGFPQQGDPGTWYEWSYVFGQDGVYDLQSLLHEYLFHLVVAALGIYVLLQRLGFSWLLAAAFGVSYSLNGFFLGNAQHLGWIIGLTWLPWMMFALVLFLRSIRDRKSPLLPALLLGLFAHWQFVGGYLGVTAIALYCMLLMLLAWNVWHFKRKSSPFLVKQLGWLVVSFVCFLGLSLPAVLSFWDLQSQITRSTALSIADAQFGFWPWQAVSTLFGFSPTAEMAQALQSDISLINVRWMVLPMGLWVISFCLLLWRRHWVFSTAVRRQIWVSGLLLLASLLCFLIAAGPSTPLHRWLVYAMPLLKLFRFPAIYRGVGLLLLLLASAYLVRYWAMRYPRWKYLAVLWMLVEVAFGAHRDIKHTVLIQIPAHEVNEVLHRLSVERQGLVSGGMQLPKRFEVDANARLDEKVPFMRLNQGVYLKLWARDGYNPYQLSTREMAMSHALVDSVGLVGLDSMGKVVSGGIVACREYQGNGESIVVRGLRCAPTVRSLLCFQTPAKHWVLRSGKSRLNWENYADQAIKMPVMEDFELTFEPYYMGYLTKFTWALFLFVVPLTLIINGIPKIGRNKA